MKETCRRELLFALTTTTEIMFEEVASLLSEKRPLIEPRQSRSELVNKTIFPEVGANLSMDDRRALARSMDAYEVCLVIRSRAGADF